MFRSREQVIAAVIGTMMVLQNATLIHASVISLNFASDVASQSGGGGTTAVGSNIAGVVPVDDWNDIPLALQTNLALMFDTGATVPGLTLSTAQTYAYSGSAFDAAGVSFAQAGDTSMMRGHIYLSGGAAVDLTFTGTIPYSTFDIYIYYNSGGITNTQTFSILDSSLSSLGLSRTGSEVSGGDTAFVLSDNAGNNANYVLFSGLTSAQVPTNFVIRAQGGFGYFNGLQIVEVLVPEPSTFLLAVLGLSGIGCVGRRRRQQRS